MKRLLALVLVALVIAADPTDALAAKKKKKKKKRSEDVSEVMPEPAAPAPEAPAAPPAAPPSLLDATPIIQESPAGADAPADAPFLQAQITDVQLKGPAKPALPIALDPPSLPVDLALIDPDPRTGRLPPNPSWDANFTFQAGSPDWTVLVGKSAARVRDGKATIAVPVRLGKSTHRITVIDPFGKVSEYDLTVTVEKSGPAATQGPEPKGFLVVGPVFYTRSISRSGTAVLVPSQVSGMYSGVRGIYRRRLIKEITQRIPGNPKFFWDNSGTLGTILSGDEAVRGFPIWADSRVTLELFQSGGLRVEGGAGLSFFMPGVAVAQAGDLEQFFGFMLSTRFGYPVSKKLFILTGFNFTLPSSDSSATDILVTQPIEAFLSLTTPRGSDGFWELRFKYFRIKTSGSVIRAGSFERVESFFGPEILWSKRF
jgi:hypothetical protein